MKKFILLGAFVMIASSAVIAETSNTIEDDMFACTTVYTSCGVVGNSCGNTTLDILEAAADLEKWMCG